MLKLASSRATCLLPTSITFGLLLFSQPCFATFVVLSNNDPQPDQEVVQIVNDLIGTFIQGATNQTDTQVDITSASQFLASTGPGIEARALADIGSSQVAIDDSITISLVNPDLAFRALAFNAFNGGPLGSGGTLTITVNGQESDGSPVSTSFTQDFEGSALMIDNGSNFFTVVAIEGQRITSVDISPNANSSYVGLRQIRIGGIIPEPATWSLVGLAIVAMAVKRQASRLAVLQENTCGN